MIQSDLLGVIPEILTFKVNLLLLDYFSLWFNAHYLSISKRALSQSLCICECARKSLCHIHSYGLQEGSICITGILFTVLIRVGM